MEEEEEGGGGGGRGGGPTPGRAKGEEVLVLEWGGVFIPVAGIRGGPKTRQEQTEPHSLQLTLGQSFHAVNIKSYSRFRVPDFATF